MSHRSAEELLAHTTWLRALAVRLVRDEDIADDLVQDTWLATLRRPPERSEGAKAWLAKVMLNRLRMRVRSEGRRGAREQALALIDDDRVPAQDVVVARAELHRKLVDLVLRLDEPYRTTVLLHFCEGVPLASLARTQGLPASTVRSRLKAALDQLRSGLDAEAGGRTRWAVPLLAIPKGVLVAHKTSKVVAAVIVLLLLLLLVGGTWLLRDRMGSEADRAGTDPAGATAGAQRHLGAVPFALGEAPGRPAWLIQPDVEPRRIAGRVVFEGAPVAGAIVELADLSTESGRGAALRRTTNAAGAFDFGTQPAMALSVRASAPRRASAAIGVDLRDPLVRSDQLELVLGGCDAAMIGTVRDASGGTIANARIARLELERHGDVPGGPAVTTDDDGAYELCVETRWPPSVTVEVSAAGYGTIVYTAMVPGRVETDFALVPEATIVGRVIRDDTRQPVADAYVYVPAGPPGVQRTGARATFTDGAGHFRIDRLAPGNHVVFARADGLGDAVRGVAVAVAAGQTSAEIELRLAAGSTIRGRVVDDGKPVVGARVAAAHRTAISQHDGSYVLTGVPRGEVALTALPYDVVEPQRLTVSQPRHDGVVIEVDALGTITGRIVRGRDPVPGAAVYLSGPNERELEPVVADRDGRFVARGLRAGPWTLGASSPQLGAFGPAKEAVVELARGQTKDVTIELAYAASISGRVVDQHGDPVRAVIVQFMHTAANDVGLTTSTMDGSFRVAMMTGGGQYRPVVSATSSGSPTRTPLPPASGTALPLITLTDGSSEVNGVVLAVRLERREIAGTVVDAGGAPVPDARVVAELVVGSDEPRFFRGVQAPTATTDVDGRFAIGELLDGSYALRATSPAGIDGTLLGIRAGRSDVTLTLQAPGTIEATIVGFEATPSVVALASGGVRASAPVQGTLQGSVARFANLAPGSYVVTARTPREGASAMVQVASRQTTRVTLASRGTGAVAGRVRDARTGKPIEGMTCRAQTRVGITLAPGGPGDAVQTDGQGAFVLDAPSGDLAISCDGLSAQYSDGLRLIALPATQRVDVEVLVVPWSGSALAGIGAELDPRVLVPRLVRVRRGGPAAAAGFADGDVITAVDGSSVAALSAGGAWLLLVNRAPGTTVKVEAARGGTTIGGEIVLGAH